MTTGPVSRILSPVLRPGDGHSSRPRIAAWLKRPTRKLDAPSQPVPPDLSGELLPYLVLLRVGFALPRASLPGRCALTAPFHPYPDESGRYVFCGTFRRPGLNQTSRMLSGTLPCGVRTFLPGRALLRRSERPRGKSDRPVRLPPLIIRVSGGARGPPSGQERGWTLC